MTVEAKTKCVDLYPGDFEDRQLFDQLAKDDAAESQPLSEQYKSIITDFELLLVRLPQDSEARRTKRDILDESLLLLRLWGTDINVHGNAFAVLESNYPKEASHIGRHLQIIDHTLHDREFTEYIQNTYSNNIIPSDNTALLDKLNNAIQELSYLTESIQLCTELYLQTGPASRIKNALEARDAAREEAQPSNDAISSSAATYLSQRISIDNSSASIENKIKRPLRVDSDPIDASLKLAPKMTGSQTRERWMSTLARVKREVSSTNSYEYQNVANTETRLVIIRPSRGSSDPISIFLAHVSYGDLNDIEYIAISYDWAPELDANRSLAVSETFTDLDKLKNILTGGKTFQPESNQGEVIVRENVHAALRYFRDSKLHVAIWIDCLSLDMSNFPEKASQIPHMAEIFSKATTVDCWLGEGQSKTSGQAFSIIQRVIQFNLFDPKLEADSWQALLDLLRHRWFTRRWIIQEVALAKRAFVHYGNMRILWSDFSDAISLLSNSVDSIRKFLHTSTRYEVFPQERKILQGFKVVNSLVELVSNVFRRQNDGIILEKRLTLEELVCTLTDFACGDPRDTIFSLCSLAREIPSAYLPHGQQLVYTPLPPPNPDYSKSLQQVYVEFAKFSIASSGSLDIICRPWASIPGPTHFVWDISNADIPSWLCLTTNAAFGTGQNMFERINGDSLVGNPSSRIYQASHNKHADLQDALPSYQYKPVEWHRMRESSMLESPPPPKTLDSEMTLQVKGIVIGTIDWLSSPTVDGVISKECLQKGGWDVLKETSEYVVPDKLWRTLSGDRGPNGHNPPAYYHRACAYALTRRSANGHLNTERILASEGLPNSVSEYVKRAQAVTWNRCFFEATATQSGTAVSDTEDPLFGLCPPGSQTGDIVAILSGCSVPCILRLKPSAENHGEGPKSYELVGESFVYGQMDGEAIISLSDHEQRRRTEEILLV